MIQELHRTGLEVYATLAPLLPCDPERLAQLAIDASGRDLIGDALHVRDSKPRGATTRRSAFEIARHHGDTAWFEPEFQQHVISAIERVTAKAAVNSLLERAVSAGWRSADTLG